MSNPSSRDSSPRCAFVFSDGRRCTMPESPDSLGLCYFHGKIHADSVKGEFAGREVSRFLDSDINTACDLNATFVMLFRAAAQNLIKPKTAQVLINLGHLLIQSHLLAKQEFLASFKEPWPEIVQQSLIFNPEDDNVILFPEPPKADAPSAPEPDSPSDEDHPGSDPRKIM